ncbi:MAG: hypothetical protein JXA37_02070 [Chloroflexia bacterium]|nr:hypothetical protein [Chloroflexia bacterium]
MRIHNKEGDTHPGGCVDPHLVGSNNCQETLDISISKLSISQTYSFAPGEQVDVLVALEVADNQGDRYSFNLPATLGEQAITISFHTWRQDP